MLYTVAKIERQQTEMSFLYEKPLSYFNVSNWKEVDFLKIVYNVEILKKNYIEILKQNAANIAIWENKPHL